MRKNRILKSVLPILACLMTSVVARAQIDTLEISTLYTTYVRFPIELLTAERSDSENIDGEIVPESKNIIRMRAIKPFSRTSNLTVIDSKGYLHTYYIKYCEHPATTYYDKSGAEEISQDESTVSYDNRQGTSVFDKKGRDNRQGNGAGTQSNKVSRFRKDDAPQLKEIISLPQEVFHLAVKAGKIALTCENIFTYSDILYLVFRIDNRSGVSFESDGLTFTLATKSKKSKVPISTTNLYPKGRFGTLSVAPKESGTIAYSLEKQTLTPNQILQISVSERTGNRELMMTLTPDDINLASSPLD